MKFGKESKDPTISFEINDKNQECMIQVISLISVLAGKIKR